MTCVGIIGGTGWLGSAIGQVLLSSKFVDQLWNSNRCGRVPKEFEGNAAVHFTTNNQEVLDRCSIVIVSVLPHDFDSFASQVHCGEKLIVSVMAGIPMERLLKLSPKIIRSLPNAAAQYKLSYTPWIASSGVTIEEKKTIQKLFETFGTADEVESEDLVDYFTGLTGGGPFLLSYFAGAMIEDAIHHGVSARLAEKAVRQLFHGGGMLLAKNTESPAQTVRSLIEYNGTTAAGLREFQKFNLSDNIARGLTASYHKAKDGSLLAKKET